MTSETRVRQQWHAVESGDGGATIKSETGGYVGTIQWKGDAHDIAREHNSHDDLLAAMRDAIWAIDSACHAMPSDPESIERDLPIYEALERAQVLLYDAFERAGVNPDHLPHRARGED